MESLQIEVMAEERRQQLIRAMRQVRLETEATASHADWFAQAMLHLGQWMIVFGEGLRQRYDKAWAGTHPIQHHLSLGQR